MIKKDFSKYEYPQLERVDLEIGRHYLDSNNNPVPSVTTILQNLRMELLNGEIELVMRRLTELSNKVLI